jgi:hypothetical protein
MRTGPLFSLFVLSAFPTLVLIACSERSSTISSLPSTAVTVTAPFAIEPLKKVKELFAGYEGGVCIFKNKNWKEQGCFSSGLNNPFDVSADRKGNLYVANFDGGNITEYDGGSTSPSFTYHGSPHPLAIAVDRHGNIFESGATGASQFVINEFHRGADHIVASCTPPGEGSYGVAVDKHGDLFIDPFIPSEVVLFEYKGGLPGCAATQLATLPAPGVGRGMVVDKNDTLLVCNMNPPEIDVYKPPYGSLSGTFGPPSGLVAFDIALSKKNDVAYVASEGIDVFAYPSGSRIAFIPIYEFTSLVDGINYAP